MADPYWVDERGRRVPKKPCPKCGANVGPVNLRVEDLRHLGWRAYRVESYVNWCGHAQEVIPIPQPGGLVLVIPIFEEAK